MKKMDLDPIGDRDFLLQIIRFYDFNLKLVTKECSCSNNQPFSSFYTILASNISAIIYYLIT